MLLASVFLHNALFGRSFEFLLALLKFTGKHLQLGGVSLQVNVGSLLVRLPREHCHTNDNAIELNKQTTATLLNVVHTQIGN